MLSVLLIITNTLPVTGSACVDSGTDISNRRSGMLMMHTARRSDVSHVFHPLDKYILLNGRFVISCLQQTLYQKMGLLFPAHPYSLNYLLGPR